MKNTKNKSKTQIKNTNQKHKSKTQIKNTFFLGK